MPRWWKELTLPIFQPPGFQWPWGNPGGQEAWLSPGGQGLHLWWHLGPPVPWAWLGEGQGQALDRVSLCPPAIKAQIRHRSCPGLAQGPGRELVMLTGCAFAAVAWLYVISATKQGRCHYPHFADAQLRLRRLSDGEAESLFMPSPPSNLPN